MSYSKIDQGCSNRVLFNTIYDSQFTIYHSLFTFYLLSFPNQEKFSTAVIPATEPGSSKDITGSEAVIRLKEEWTVDIGLDSGFRRNDDKILICKY